MSSERPRARRSDEALYALALYLESLRPPPNPNPIDEKAWAGQGHRFGLNLNSEERAQLIAFLRTL